MPWRLTPDTYNNNDINDSLYESKFLHAHQPMKLLTREPIETPIPGDYSFPASPRSQVMGGQLILTVKVKTQSQSGMDAARRIFDRYAGFVELGALDGNGTAYTLSVKCVSFIEREDSPYHFTAVLYTNRPIFETAEISDTLRTITATPTGFQLSPAVAGTVRNYPKFEFKPTVAKANTADYTKRRQVSIGWRSEFPGQDSRGLGYPIDIANDSFDTAAEIAAGRMLASGNDLVVYVDGVLYPRTLWGINTTTTQVWVPIHFAPGRTATLTTAMASGASPANGGEIVASNGELGLLGWPDRGYLKIENECIWYGSRTTDRFQNIKRAMRDTTAAAHSAAVRLDWVEHDIQMIYGYTAATAPTVPDFAIDITVSTNIFHKHVSNFVDFTGTRYGQVVGRYTEDNIASASLSLQENATGLTFADKAPGAGGYYPFNNAELYVPCGVKAAAAAITYDIQGVDVGTLSPGADVALTARVFGVDVATGVEKLLASYAKTARGTAKTITPDSVLSRLRFNALYTAITGAWDAATPGSGTIQNSGVGGTSEHAQSFRLTEAAAIKAIAMFVALNGGTRVLEVALVEAASPDAPGASGLTIKYDIPAAQILTTNKWCYGESTLSIPRISAQRVFLLYAAAVAGSGTITGAVWADGNYADGERWTESASVWTRSLASDQGFLIIGDGSVVQPDAPLGMEGALNWDNLEIDLDDATPRTPTIFIAPRSDIYFLRGVLSHNGTDQTITLNYIAAVNETITVDCFRKVVIVDDDRGIYAPGAVTLSDPEQWMHLRGTGSASSNTLTYTETGIGTVTIQTKWKDALA